MLLFLVFIFLCCHLSQISPSSCTTAVALVLELFHCVYHNRSRIFAYFILDVVVICFFSFLPLSALFVVYDYYYANCRGSE